MAPNEGAEWLHGYLGKSGAGREVFLQRWKDGRAVVRQRRQQRTAQRDATAADVIASLTQRVEVNVEDDSVAEWEGVLAVAIHGNEGEGEEPQLEDHLILSNDDSM